MANKYLRKVIVCLVVVLLIFSCSIGNIFATTIVKNIKKDDIIIESVDSKKAIDNVVSLGEKVVIKFKGNIDTRGLKFRLQEKIDDNNWKAISDYSSELPNYSFSNGTVIGLHIDIVNENDTNEKNGIWLGQFSILDNMVQNITDKDIILESQNQKTIIDGSTLALGEKVTVKLKEGINSNNIKVRLQEKVGDKEWTVLGDFSSGSPVYTFHKEGIVGLHIDIIDVNNSLNSKGMYIGTFKVERQGIVTMLIKMVSRYPLIFLILIVSACIYSVGFAKKILKKPL